jgi:hypothetical protein
VSCGFTELAEFYVVHLAQLRSKFVDVENCLDSGNHLDGFYQSAVMAQDEIDSAKYNPVENEKLRYLVKDGGADFRTRFSDTRLIPPNLVRIVQVFSMGYHFDAVVALQSAANSPECTGPGISVECLFINFCKFSNAL